MNLNELKPNENVDLKVKILRKVDESEIDKDGKKLKRIKIEVEDEEGTVGEVTLWGQENYTKVHNNLEKGVWLKKMWTSSYEGRISISSGKFGYIKEIEE